ncbi:MAG: endolytic transglycosylase MltG, partial [Peptococcaceae bacterium]|nr:endolytic transglycosylase MltG [Peptococcaceae bacterium]
MSKKQSAFQNKKPSMRTYIILLVLVFAIAAVISIFAGSGAPADKDNTEKMVFQVSAGENATRITARLKEAGIIDNELFFKLYLKSNKVEDKLRVGNYVLSPSMTTEEIVYELLNGVGEMTQFTIPEGYTLRDIADLFVAEDIMTADTFW